MNRTAVNPWDWSLKFSFNQGEIIDEASRFLVCSGQTVSMATENRTFMATENCTLLGRTSRAERTFSR